VKFVPTTWSKLVTDLNADKFDIAIGGINFTPDRAKASHPTQDYSTTWKTVLTRCQNKPVLTLDKENPFPILNRPQTQIIVNQGGTNERYVRQYLPRASRRVIIGNEATLKTLLSPLSPPDLVMITDAEEAMVQKKAHPTLCTTLWPLPKSEASKVFLVNPKRPELKDAYDAWHDTYLESEAFITDRARWFYWFEIP
jgi:cyclohexadienyl dehydratase